MTEATGHTRPTLIEQIKRDREAGTQTQSLAEAQKMIARRDAALLAAEELAEWVEGFLEDGCPKCGGDCSSANPPVTFCPQREVMRDLTAYRKATEGEG